MQAMARSGMGPALRQPRKRRLPPASEPCVRLHLSNPPWCFCIKKPAPLGAEFMRREASFAIENMLQYLPLDTSKEELQKWYNGPYDWHPSNYGAAIYAQAVRPRVADYIGKIAAKRTSILTH
jgi:hypothetical protein